MLCGVKTVSSALSGRFMCSARDQSPGSSTTQPSYTPLGKLFIHPTGSHHMSGMFRHLTSLVTPAFREEGQVVTVWYE